MSAEVEQKTEQTVEQKALQVASQGSYELMQFVADLQLAYKAAAALVETAFVPSTYRGRPQEAAAAIVAGHEMGLSPMAALRSIDIIGGTPAIRAVALRAQVQSAGHEIWVVESTSTRCVVKGRRKNSDKVETSDWPIARAQALGLTSKDNWRKQPTSMLLARATSEIARLIASDALLGIPYTVEELTDSEPVQPDVAQPVKRSTRKKRRTIEDPPVQESSDWAALPSEETTPKPVKEPESKPEPESVKAESKPQKTGFVRKDTKPVETDSKSEVPGWEPSLPGFESDGEKK